MIKFLDEYRDADLCLKISDMIKKISSKPFNIMEVCGGHTMSIRKNGIHKLVGDNINLISGPGCPVCVTSIGDIDKAISAASDHNAVVCTFGDMIYVPGSVSSLAKAKADGCDIRTVYSSYDVLKFAREEPDKKFVFISIGFETTTPTIAAAIQQAKRDGITNFSVIALNKTMPRALSAVLKDENSRIEALICPGHVTTITGTEMYKPIVEELGVSCCVSGFEPADLLRAVYTLAELHEKGKTGLVNAYERVVLEEGNEKARRIVADVFEEADVEWRGFGVIPGSGMRVNGKYKDFDAENIFDIKVPETKEFEGCVCGDILRGAKRPSDCPLFKGICTPLDPKGACMVSSEGTCAAWYKYGG